MFQYGFQNSGDKEESNIFQRNQTVHTQPTRKQNGLRNSYISLKKFSHKKKNTVTIKQTLNMYLTAGCDMTA